MTILFQQHNVHVDVLEADEYELRVIDTACSFITTENMWIAEAAAGNWDGFTRFLRRPKTRDPWIPAGLLVTAMKALEVCGIGFSLEDCRKREHSSEPFEATTPIDLRDYQKEAVELAVKQGAGVIVAPPRSGKTRILMEIHRRIGMRALWVAPTNAIVTQTLAVANQFFPEGHALVADAEGSKRAALAPLAICTAAKAITLKPDFLQARKVLILDEMHHFTKTGTWGRVLQKRTPHIYWRLGATGTFFRSGGDDLALYAVLANEIFSISTTDLEKRGHLVKTRFFFLPVLEVYKKYKGMGIDMLRNAIWEHELRNQMIAWASTVLAVRGRTVLILVGTKAQGYKVLELLKGMLPKAPMGAEFQTVEFVSTDRPRHIIQKIFKSFTSSQEVKILVGTSLVGEGVDLPVADALVYGRGGKAEVTLVQSWFRVCTAIPGKKDAIVVDFGDRHHSKCAIHADERLRVAASEPIFNVEVLNHPTEFAMRLDQGA